MTRDYVCIDSETVGLFGPIVLFQFGEGDDGPIKLWSPMSERIRDTLELYKWLSTKRILGFNLSFDIFKVCQQLTTLMLLGKRVGLDTKPIDHVDAYALCEPQARDGPCFKPLGAMDLMLHARKGPWQNLMNRDPIIIRRVPVQLAPVVLRELEARVKIPSIFFAKRKNLHEGLWKVKPIKTAEGTHPDLVNLQLDFAPSSALKALATHELGLDPTQTLLFSDVEVAAKHRPVELGFAPFALAIGKPGKWNGAWPDVIDVHHNHWLYNELAREYATKDIVYPRALYEKWGRPAFDDVDSLLACLAGATRWKGYSINVPGIQKLKAAAQEKMKLAPRAPSKVVQYLGEVMTPVERIGLIDSKSGKLTTKKVVLEEVTRLKECPKCLASEQHDDCKPFLITHPAAKRAQLVLESRQGKKQVEIYEKLELARRFHVSVNVIGARSTRQSGGQVTEDKKVRKSAGLNPQGINKAKFVREQFTLAFTPEVMADVAKQMQEWLGAQATRMHEPMHVGLHTEEWAELGYPILPEKLVGGDFSGFELNISDAFYEDPQLHADLNAVEPGCEYGECKYTNAEHQPCCTKCTGKPAKAIKLHALFGTMVYSGRTYWEVRATDGKERDELSKLFPSWPQQHWENLYTRAKSALFAFFFFGDASTFVSRLAIERVDAEKAYRAVLARWPVMAKKRQWFVEHFSPMSQPDGGRVYWNDPDDYVESMLGFKRFYTMENLIIRTLYELAEDVPPEWRAVKLKVVRKEKEQTLAGAVRSALYGAAFGLQGANTRSAGNHKIQSTGAQITKELQADVWTYQPTGINSWVCRPMNVHDELDVALVAGIEASVAETQGRFIKKRKAVVPGLEMKWKAMATWAGK